MVIHYIIMSSSYSLGKRIAFDYCLSENDTAESIQEMVKKIIDKCGEDVSISTHSFQTEDSTWKSVEKNDPFFKGVKVVKNLDEFISLIQKDRKINGFDVAKYIVSKIECTHLKLEKLVYLSYAEYLCKTGSKLFEDNIYAFELGPVVETVYEKYKGYSKTIESEIAKSSLKVSDGTEMSARSRILFAECGIEKDSIIRKTLEKYGDLSARQLVDITHRENTPWQVTYDGTKYKKINDQVIISNHKFEELT